VELEANLEAKEVPVVLGATVGTLVETGVMVVVPVCGGIAPS